MFVMAATSVPFQQNKKARKAAKRDSIELKADSTADSIVALMRDSIGRVIVDTTKMDSLQLAIYHHNQAIDDSIRLDSLNRQRSNGINSPVEYSANDSLVYDATSKTARLYGD